MDAKIIEFLEKERISVLTTLLEDGSPHSATMVFVFDKNTNEIYFLTDKTSKKCALLRNGTFVRASVVLGFNEQEMVTLQMDGEVKVIAPDLVEKVRGLYLAKYPDHKRYDNESSEYLVFKPSWWRYTDFKPVPNYIISSS